MADAEKMPAQKQIYADSALTLYDLRIRYFKNEGYVTDRKAFAAYKYKTDDPGYQEELLSLFKKSFELNGSNVMDVNTMLYMNTVRKYQTSSKTKLSNEQVMDIYDNIIAVIEDKMDGQSPADLDEMMDKIDGILIELVPINCQFIDKNYPLKSK